MSKREKRKGANMYVAKIEVNSVRIYDVQTGALKKSFTVPDGPVSAQVEGDLVSITNKKGKVYVYDIKTGFLKKTF